MYRTSSHEPRYKQSTRKARNDESREASENSTSEEEEESTESGTEESDDTLGSQGSESVQKSSLYSAESSCHQRKSLNSQNVTDSLITSHVCHSRIIKHDKVTQKNLLSPLPSFTIPPVYREIPGPAYRGHSGRSNRDKPIETKRSSGRPPKHIPKKKESDDEKEDSVCYIHKSCDRQEYDKHRIQKDQSRSNRSERILTCVNASTVIEPPGKGFPETPSGKDQTQPAPAPTVIVRRPKTADVETVTTSKCLENRVVRSRRKSTTGTSSMIVDQTQSGEAVPAKGKKSRKVAGDGSGEVREKLVYVVEEKGKDVAKLETDLFTLNEILAIKKDLLELSEFAKKLKKLKEMKRETETGTNHETSCQCKPAADLLKDVNRRIEALEARQEELERGSKSDPKGDTETDSKKTTSGKKASLDSQSKTPVAMKASAMTTIPSFPKMEMFVSRTDNFSNNSDIVNELMDIKTQLHKLEQKRMSKGVPEEASPAEDTKLAKKDDHAIAVFSSRTYILTENFEKRKQGLKANDEDKLNNYCSTAEEESRKEQTKEHVANWLRGVSPKNQETAYLPPSGPKRDDNFQRGIERKNDLKCKNCSQVLKVDDFQNQEPQKNRATEKDGRVESDLGFADSGKNDSPVKQSSQVMKYRECIVTPSGKIFACVNNSSGRTSTDCPDGQYRPKSARPPLSQGNERTEFCCSVSSAVLAKEYVRKLKADVSRGRHCGGLPPRVISSKSVQELTVNSSKTEKTVRNTNLKNKGKMAQPKDKKHKDGKNQCLKLLEAHLVALRKTLKRGSTSTSSCTRSEFLASVNLDTGSTSETIRMQGSGDNKAIIAYSATTKREENIEDCIEERDRRRMREEERKRKRRETECKKLLKKKLKQQKKCESAERKRRREQHKTEMRQMKQRCKELNYCKPFEESLPKKKSKSFDNCSPIKRSAEVCTPKKSRSSQEFPTKKSHYTDESALKKHCCSSDSFCRRPHRPHEHLRKYCCELVPSPKPRRCEEEHVPRKHRYGEDCDERYKEDFHRRHYEKDEVPRKHRYEEEDFAQRYKEELGRRHYGKDETPRRQRLEEGHKPLFEETPKKTNRSSREKRYKEEDYQRSSEDKSETSQCDKSDDSWRIYKKRQEEELRKMKYKMSKRPSESCKLKNVMKNLGMLKINFPFAGEFCDGKHGKCKKSTTSETPEKPEKPEKLEKPEKQTDRRREREREAYDDEKFQWEFSPSNYDDDDEDDEDEYDDDEYRSRSGTYPEHHSRHYRNDHPQQDHQQFHYSHHHAGRPDYQKNCRCVYLQSQVQRGWSGLRPFRKLSSDSATEVTSSKTAESSKTFKNNFGLPKVKTPVFHVTYSCEDKEEKCRRKCRQKREKCERKKCKRKHHKKHKNKCKKCRDEYRCRCKKCGNIHRKGCLAEHFNSTPPPLQMECYKPQQASVIPKEPNKCEPDSPPIISFLSHFCKSRPRDQKAARFFKKLDEVRYLKTCATVRRKSSKRQRWPKSSLKSEGSCTGEGKCKCKPKLTEIESRLSILENRKDECLNKCCKNKHKKKKKKPKCDKKCCKSTDCEYHSTECSECPKKECCDRRKGCGDCQRKDCAECQKKESIEYERKELGGCPKKEYCECGGKGCQRKGCCECKKKHKKKKKKSCYEECCLHSDTEECRCEKKKKHKKRKKCKCCEGEEGEHPRESVEKPCEPVPKPFETAAYYQTIYCPSAVDTKNNSSLSVTSKSSTVEEKESTGTTKSKEEPPQKAQRMREGLSSLHSFWKNLRRYRITYGRNGMENLMKKIRGKKSSCMMEPDVATVEDLSKERLRQVAEMEARKSKKKAKEMRERKSPKPCRKRHA